MIDFHAALVSALHKVLPVHYEMALTKDTEVPCISYMELNNYVEESGDTLEYSRLTYQVKIWGHSIEDLQTYSVLVDVVLRPIGFKRIASGELYDNESTMMQKILTYEARASETY